MLVTETYSPTDIASTNQRNESFFNDRWLHLRTVALDIMEYRLATAEKEWYIDGWKQQHESFLATEQIESASSVNRFSKGILAEVYFLMVCDELHIPCAVANGKEDIWGVDFSIGEGKEVRHIDVSSNCSQKSIEHKSAVQSMPTIFVPWLINHNSVFEPIKYQQEGTSYVEQYLRTGKVSARAYMHSLLKLNYQILDCINRYVWRDLPPRRLLYNGQEFSAERSGIMYVRNLEGVLTMLSKLL